MRDNQLLTPNLFCLRNYRNIVFSNIRLIWKRVKSLFDFYKSSLNLLYKSYHPTEKMITMIKIYD